MPLRQAHMSGHIGAFACSNSRLNAATILAPVRAEAKLEKVSMDISIIPLCLLEAFLAADPRGLPAIVQIFHAYMEVFSESVLESVYEVYMRSRHQRNLATATRITPGT